MDNNDKKLVSLKWSDEIISIFFDITYKCNYHCDYCIAQNRWNVFFSINDIEKINDFLINVREIYPNHHINFVITWWEPTIHKEWIKVITSLLSINIDNFSITFLTNWSLLYLYTEKLKKMFDLYNTNKITFEVSYHVDECTGILFDNFVEWIKELYSIWYKVKLVYLMPTWWDKDKSFEKLNHIIKNIWWEIDIEYKLLRDYNIVNQKRIVSKLYTDNDYNLAKKSLKNKFILSFSDNTIENVDKTYIYKKWYNVFKWWYCYPFRSSMNFVLFPDCSLVIAWCYTFSKEVFNLWDSKIYDLLRKNKDYHVRCCNEVCSFSINLPLYKEKMIYDNDEINKLEKNYFSIFEKLKHVWINLNNVNYYDNLHSLVQLKLLYLIDWTDNVLSIIIEKKEFSQKYIYSNKNYGLQYFFQTKRWAILKDFSIDLEKQFLFKIFTYFLIFEKNK